MSEATPLPAPSAPSLWQASGYWLKLGCISFGGPAGQIAMMHRELVEQRRWISESRFLHALNYCMVLPGPEAQQLATYIGWLLHGRWGGIVAGGLFVLPSFFLLAALSWLYMTLGPAVTTPALHGVKPAVVAIVAFAVWRIGRKVLRRGELWIITALAFTAILLLKLPYPLIVLSAAAAGWLLRRRLRSTGSGVAHPAASASKVAALIDDHTPSPSHASASWRGFAAVLATGVALWALVLLALREGDPLLAPMAGFFTRAALLTFGGAYAVMPYVFQAAVNQYHWLSTAQMLDGLALGETTPGPLIIVVEFVGFVAAWSQAAVPGLSAGLLGAATAVFFTFLPSFVLILAGAPLVERMRGGLGLEAPLQAVTAAVVGTMLYLAVYLAAQVFWPHGWAGGLDAGTLLLALAAWWLLYREWLGMVPVILGSAVLGWGLASLQGVLG